MGYYFWQQTLNNTGWAKYENYSINFLLILMQGRNFLSWTSIYIYCTLIIWLVTFYLSLNSRLVPKALLKKQYLTCIWDMLFSQFLQIKKWTVCRRRNCFLLWRALPRNTNTIKFSPGMPRFHLQLSHISIHLLWHLGLFKWQLGMDRAFLFLKIFETFQLIVKIYINNSD